MWTASCVSSVSMFASYLYDFSFLGDDSTITVDDNRIDPLYKHVFPPEVAPQLSFIGLPWKASFARTAAYQFRTLDTLVSCNLPRDPKI